MNFAFISTCLIHCGSNRHRQCTYRNVEMRTGGSMYYFEKNSEKLETLLGYTFLPTRERTYMIFVMIMWAKYCRNSGNADNCNDLKSKPNGCKRISNIQSLPDKCSFWRESTTVLKENVESDCNKSERKAFIYNFQSGGRVRCITQYLFQSGWYKKLHSTGREFRSVIMFYLLVGLRNPIWYFLQLTWRVICLFCF